MEHEIEVVGVTNMPNSIASLLRVKDDTEYGLYKETAYGKYYAKRLPDGSLDSAKIVRLISDEQAAELEAELCAMIDGESAKFSSLTKHIPAIDPEKMKAGAFKITDEVVARIHATIGRVALLQFSK